MSEHQPRHHSPEHHQPKVETSAEHHEKLKHRIESGREAEHQLAKHESLNAIKKSIEHHAVSGKETSVGEREKPQDHTTGMIKKSAKQDAYKQLLKSEQRKLSTPERTFSKLIHSPAVEAVSELGAKTIARPSGILGGGLCALIGSTFFVYMAKHYGFRYNFFVFLLFLGGGFVVGLMLELLLSGLRRASRKS